ncbi:MarR family transcriptional regulator [Streptomyces sp. NPDC050508]|uniref:MarR family winged helix-turn-helix transcriptional regulator n=1 Tax=Streptomyces sp. NPDC050508 TaxID=3155405 RepID=UPI0034402AEB
MGVDRATMVSLIDGLEEHGLAERRRSPQDCRKNIVELTAAGQYCLRRAEKARRAVERRFLAPLDEAAASLVRALQTLVLAG